MKTKKLNLILLALALQATSFAQLTIGKQKTIGGSDYDIFTSMYLTKDSGVIVGGYSSSNISGEKTQNSKGTIDYWIVKLNKQGQIQWDKTIGARLGDYLYALQQTRDGGYILGGVSSSPRSGDKTQDSIGQTDYWVVKLDASGNVQWDKTLGGNLRDIFTSLQQTSDGGYIIAGYSTSNISGTKTENSKGFFDYWIVKLNSAGNILWDKTIGGNNADKLESIKQTSDGGYILGGSSVSVTSGDKTENSQGLYDYWVVKTDASGNVQWDNTIGGNSEDYLSALQQTKDGGYILGGSSISDKSGDKSENIRGRDDYWVVKLNSAGTIQWDKTIGGTEFDDLFSILQSNDGGYVLGGYSYSNISGEKTENSKGANDYWVVKLDGAGNKQWDKTVGGNSNDYMRSVLQTPRGDYMLGGYSNSDKSGDKTENSRGFSDYWIIQLNVAGNVVNSIPLTSSAVINNKENKNFFVYPNPAKNVLHIQLKGNTTVSLINDAGEIILTQTINSNGEINIASLPHGLYYLKNNATGETQKVVIK